MCVYSQRIYLLLDESLRKRSFPKGAKRKPIGVGARFPAHIQRESNCPWRDRMAKIARKFYEDALLIHFICLFPSLSILEPLYVAFNAHFSQLLALEVIRGINICLWLSSFVVRPETLQESAIRVSIRPGGQLPSLDIIAYHKL